MKIITAIGNPYLNTKLIEYGIGEIVCTDIQYGEGVIEVLEENKNIDLIILSNNLPGEYEFRKLIDEIVKKKENIEIITFLKEKDEYIESFLNSKNIYKIYYLNDKGYQKFLSTFCVENNSIDIKKEIKDFKNLILTNKKFKQISELNQKYIQSGEYKFEKENNIKKLIVKEVKKDCKNIIKTFEKDNKNSTSKLENDIEEVERNNNNLKKYNSKIIVISGNFSSGKSLISIILSKYVESKNKKVLLIDFDINNSINIILGIKKIAEGKLEKLIKCLEKDLYVLCGTENFLNKVDDFNSYEISEFFEKIKNNFDFIIVDISSENKLKYIKRILQKADKIIFLLEPNFVEIKKAKDTLEVYFRDWNISNQKVKLLLNKVNKYKISDDIIKEIFSKIELIGSLKYDENYTLLINKNFNNYVCENDYKKIYEDIIT